MANGSNNAKKRQGINHADQCVRTWLRGNRLCSLLADRGHTVIGIDKAKAKVDLIGAGRSPVVEREIDEIVKRNVEKGHLTATSDVTQAVKCTDMSIVCVGTPSRRNGALGLIAIEAVSTEIGEAIRSKSTRHEVVVRSTVLPGTTRNVILPRLIEASRKEPGNAFGVAFNPE